MEIYHLLEMPEAKDRLGITRKGKNQALFSGSFEQCVEEKKRFLANPQLLADIRLAESKQAEKRVNSLIKKFK